LLRYALGVTIASEHADQLHTLADKLDPYTHGVWLEPADFKAGAELLREIAGHLERIAKGGDADPAAEAAHKARTAER
jgi:hypothetical protein